MNTDNTSTDSLTSTENKSISTESITHSTKALPVIPLMHEDAEGMTELTKRHLQVMLTSDPQRISMFINWQ